MAIHPGPPAASVAPDRPARQGMQQRTPRRRRRDGRVAAVYLVPAAVVIVGLMAYPIYQLVLISFYDYGQPQAAGVAPLHFIGMDNYVVLFGDPQFWTVLVQTILFAAVCVVGSLLVGTALAVLAT